MYTSGLASEKLYQHFPRVLPEMATGAYQPPLFFPDISAGI